MDRTKALLTEEDLVFEQTHCGTCGKTGREDTFNLCVVCGAAWCDRCAPACSHSTEE